VRYEPQIPFKLTETIYNTEHHINYALHEMINRHRTNQVREKTDLTERGAEGQYMHIL